MNNLYKLVLVCAVSIAPQMYGMQLEVKRKAATSIEAQSADAIAEARIQCVVETITLPSTIYNIIADYVQPSASYTEHEAYTRKKKLVVNCSNFKPLNASTIEFTDTTNERRPFCFAYDFETQQQSTPFRPLLNDISYFCPENNMRARLSNNYQIDFARGTQGVQLNIYAPHGRVAIHTLNLPKERIHGCKELHENILAITSIKPGDQQIFTTTVWNFITNDKETYDCRLDGCQPVSPHYCVFTQQDDSDVVTIKNFTSKVKTKLKLAGRKQHKLYRFGVLDDNFFVLGDEKLALYDGKSLEHITTIKTNCYDYRTVLALKDTLITILEDAVMICKLNTKKDGLDQHKFMREIYYYPVCNERLSIDQLDSNAALITRAMYDNSNQSYHIYAPENPEDFAYMEKYLNLEPHTDCKSIWRYCQQGSLFTYQNLSRFSYNTGEIAEEALIWYDHNAVRLLQELSPETQRNLKQLLANLRERHTKLQAAGSKDPIKLADEEVAWLKALPERIQINIKSHFALAPTETAA